MSLELGMRLRAVAARAPEATAIIEDSGRRSTFADLVARAERIRRGLSNHEMGTGDRVLFAVRPSAVAIATTLAITEIGAVIVAAPLGVGDAVFGAQMRAVRPSWVVAESVLIAAMRSKVVRRVVLGRGGFLPSLDSLHDARFVASGRWLPGLGGALRLANLERAAQDGGQRGASEAAAPPSASYAELPEAEEAFIVFTSGTTAVPKAVVHTRGSLAATLDVISRHLGCAPGDRVYARDLHLQLPALLAGATAYVPPSGPYDPRRTVRMLRAHEITHMFEVTANLERLVEYCEREGSSLPPSLRYVMVGAAPVRQAFFRRLRRVLPASAVAWCVYGMTEILPIAAITLEHKLAYAGEGDIVGSPVDGVDAEISGTGELVVRGAHLFGGYLGGAAVVSHATGDLARIDDGRIVLIGRAKDMIIRREHNIYPELHEPVIEQIPGVRRCALIGLFDEGRADERVVLVIQAEQAPRSASEAAALIARVRTELLRGPHRIDDAAIPDDIVLAELPLSGRSQKVDKAAARAIAQRMRS